MKIDVLRSPRHKMSHIRSSHTKKTHRLPAPLAGAERRPTAKSQNIASGSADSTVRRAPTSRAPPTTARRAGTPGSRFVCESLCTRLTHNSLTNLLRVNTRLSNPPRQPKIARRFLALPVPFRRYRRPLKSSGSLATTATTATPAASALTPAVRFTRAAGASSRPPSLRWHRGRSSSAHHSPSCCCRPGACAA